MAKPIIRYGIYKKKSGKIIKNSQTKCMKDE